jgi:hypothetical protein
MLQVPVALRAFYCASVTTKKKQQKITFKVTLQTKFKLSPQALTPELFTDFCFEVLIKNYLILHYDTNKICTPYFPINWALQVMKQNLKNVDTPTHLNFTVAWRFLHQLHFRLNANSI